MALPSKSAGYVSQTQKAGIPAEAIDPRLVRIFGAEYTELLIAREKLLKKIRVTEQHFSVSLSEPLSKHLYDLMREDAHLLCKLINLS